MGRVHVLRPRMGVIALPAFARRTHDSVVGPLLFGGCAVLRDGNLYCFDETEFVRMGSSGNSVRSFSLRSQKAKNQTPEPGLECLHKETLSKYRNPAT